MPRVSVIIPAYNPGRFLLEAVESIRRQTYKDWELIIVDDGSTEDIKESLTSVPEAKCIRQEHLGASIARNTGIENSGGELIAFLDADDIWKPTKLALQVELMDSEPDIAFCFTDFIEIDTIGREIEQGNLAKQTSYLDLLQGPCPITTTVMLRRSCLSSCGVFDPLYVISQDYDLWLKIARSHKFSHIQSKEAFYRKHGTNITWNISLCMKEVMDILHNHKQLAVLNQDRESLLAIRTGVKAWRKHFGCAVYDVSRECLRRRSLKQFLRHFLRASFLNPGYVVESIVLWIGLRLRIVSSE
jgi:glycosyltransferase involved in cell wall biosynthesis